MFRMRLLVLLGVCFLAASGAWADEVGYVDCSNHSDATQVFGKPRKTPDVVASLACGERFTILVYGFYFSRIQTKDGQIGYIYSSLIAVDRGATAVQQNPSLQSASEKTKIPSTRALDAKPSAAAPAQTQVASAPAAAAPVQAPAAVFPAPAPVSAAPATASDVTSSSATSTNATSTSAAPASAASSSAASSNVQEPVVAPVAPAQPVSAPPAAAPVQPAAMQTETAPAQPVAAPPTEVAAAAAAPATNAPEVAAPAAQPEPAAPVAQPEPAAPAAPQPAPAKLAPVIRQVDTRDTWERPNPSVRRPPMLELYGGFAFVRMQGASGYSSTNFNGALGSFGVNVRPWLQLVGDSSYNFVTVSGTKNVLYANHYGPRFYYRGLHRLNITPFAEALVGGSRADVTPSGGPTISQNCISYKVGGGIDYRASRRWEVRAIDFDYYRTSFGTNTQQTNYSISAGVVLRLFGGSNE
jgi:hypothetical protein